MRNLVKKLICEDVLERNATAIITSHSLRELEDTCDQLALLHKGGLVLESDVQNLKTEQFKIQIAFPDDYGESRFTAIPDMKIRHFSKQGAVGQLDRDRQSRSHCSSVASDASNHFGCIARCLWRKSLLTKWKH